MRVRVAIVLLAMLLTAPAGSAAAQSFKPPKFRLNDGARDMREGPGADRWIIVMTDRRTGRVYHVHLAAHEDEVWIDGRIPPPRYSYGVGVDPVTVARAGFRRVPVQGAQQAASLDLRRVRGGWRFRARIAGSIDIDLRIRSRGPGPTLVSRYPDGHGVLRRALPVMDGVAASGRVVVPADIGSGSPRREEGLRGWRVTIVHDWWAPGPWVVGPACCGDPDVAVIRAPGGTITVMGGRTAVDLSNDDFDLPGWRGIIARRRGGRLTWCRARRASIDHQWMGPTGDDYRVDGMTVTGCGRRLRLRRIDDRLYAFAGGRRIGDLLWWHRHDDAASERE